MKVISTWQPYASLIVNGMKFFETRPWPAPKSLIGATIGIASTKVIRPEQRDAILDPDFQHWYQQTGLPSLQELPHGYLLGTVQLHSCELIDQHLRDDITQEELAFGWFDDGRYAWRLRYAKMFDNPIPIQGKQGFYDWAEPDGAGTEATVHRLGENEKAPARADAAQQGEIGRIIHLAERR